MDEQNMPASALVSVRGLAKHFPSGSGRLRKPRAPVLRVLSDINIDIIEGETLGLVGESGSGKTTLGRCIIGIHRVDAGAILYRGRNGSIIDVCSMDDARLRAMQRDVRMIFQDPFSSLNPRMRVMDIIGDALRVNGIARGTELEDRVAEMVRRVGLSPDKMRRYPHAFSGGERQRINIARALILEPRLVIADEAVSALDVSIRAQVLELLKQLQAELKLTYLFISHDLSVVEDICDRVAVMSQGDIVELADTDVMYRHPQHEYTRTLLRAVPIPDPRLRRLVRQQTSPDTTQE
ncbi:ATP-binding cassette domain-containing protein [Devosia nitrariae]|uniref:ABC transporter ATP-binding protein n=1 Tax=Devosia nitrariae TaxID=2071872 RepID=A0ABQ5W7U9_9HYPH|nr:ATP-binding cassette domain-containing protein [Devosia nitrariae]GLQ56169.1 ABC transporter ATP-binding protein [Devosia nitrariae]